MKFIVAALATLSLSTSAIAACSYNVAPIRTFFKALDKKGEFLGPLKTSGRFENSLLNGGIVVRTTGTDAWELNGDFCTADYCQSTFDEYRVSEGCLWSGDEKLKVSRATSTEIRYTLKGEAIGTMVKVLRRPASGKLYISERISDGGELLQTSVFKGN